MGARSAALRTSRNLDAPRGASAGVEAALARLATIAPLVLLTGCGASSPPGVPPTSPDSPEPIDGLDDLRAEAAPTRFYTLRFEGALVGFASEAERIGLRRRELVRREVVQLRRADEVASFEIELRLAGAVAGAASSLQATVRHCLADASRPLPPPRLGPVSDLACPPGLRPGPLATRAVAEHTAAGWQLRDERGLRSLPADAQPAEWLDVALPPPAVRDRRGVEGPMRLFFATRQFAVGRALRRYLSAETWVGTVELEGAILESTTALGRDDRPRLIVDSSGVVAERVKEPDLAALLSAPLPLADLVALTTLPIAGAPNALGAPGASSPRRLLFQLPRPAKPPPSTPGQLVTVYPAPATGPAAARVIAPPSGSPRILSAWNTLPPSTGWLAELLPQPATVEELVSLKFPAELAVAIADDTPLTPLAPGEVPSSNAGGDCTARALRFAARAERRGRRVHLATGFIVDGATLVRHRWVLVQAGARWFSIDPSSGDAPAPPTLVTLAIHDATAEGLAAAEAAFIPLRGATVTWAP